MKIAKTTKRQNKLVILLTIVLSVSIIAFPIYLFLSNEENAKNVDPSKTNLPTVDEIKTEDNKETKTTDTTSETNKTPGTPTKTPGKTPSQYENETIEDTPAYNNEQFRIPDEE